MNNKINPLILVLLFVLSGCTKSTDELLSEAKKLDSARNYSGAITIYDKILTIDINRTDIILRRAVDKGKINDFEGELNDLKTIVAADKYDITAFFYLGIVQRKKSKFNESIGALNEAIKLLEQRKREKDQPYSIAQSDHDSTTPSDADAFFERGLTYFTMDSTNKAINDFSFAISNNDSLKESYFYRGCALIRLHKSKEACQDFELSEKYGMKKALDTVRKYCLSWVDRPNQ